MARPTNVCMQDRRLLIKRIKKILTMKKIMQWVYGIVGYPYMSVVLKMAGTQEYYLNGVIFADTKMGRRSLRVYVDRMKRENRSYEVVDVVRFRSKTEYGEFLANAAEVAEKRVKRELRQTETLKQRRDVRKKGGRYVRSVRKK